MLKARYFSHDPTSFRTAQRRANRIIRHIREQKITVLKQLSQIMLSRGRQGGVRLHNDPERAVFLSGKMPRRKEKWPWCKSKVRVLTPHEDGGVGVQRLPKHSVLCLKAQRRQRLMRLYLTQQLVFSGPQTSTRKQETVRRRTARQRLVLPIMDSHHKCIIF